MDDQPTQEEIEAYYAQLREAPMGEVLMQCIGMLAGAAEAKLGRSDARAAIDGMAALTQIGQPHLGDTAEQLQGAVAQLQMAQVQLERQMAAQGAGQGEGQEGDQPRPQQPQPQQPQRPSQPQAPQQPQQKATDRLWIPGRDG